MYLVKSLDPLTLQHLYGFLSDKKKGIQGLLYKNSSIKI